ncbi:MAG: sterol desaturase family protein [Flavobacteriales bacterium]
MALINYLPLPFLFIIMLLEHLHHDRDHARTRNVRTNVLIGVAAAVVAFGARALFLPVFYMLHAHALLPDVGNGLCTWALCFVLNEFCFYWHHRAGHRVRLLWAAHSTHHSDERFDLSVGFRVPIGQGLRQFFWLPMLLLGFDPLMVMACETISLSYNFLMHTDVKGGRWMRMVEGIFNTPSLHRVHHASDKQYMDRNYGGMLVIWDRVFGTYRREEQAPHFGITEPGPHNRWGYAILGGYQRLWSTARSLSTWSARVRFLLGAPDAPLPTPSPWSSGSMVVDLIDRCQPTLHHRVPALRGATGFLTIGFCCGLSLAATAQPGTLDLNFDGDGKAYLELVDSLSDGTAIKVQPDGRIVVAGSVLINLATNYVIIARFLPDGSPDPSFGSGGRTITDLVNTHANPPAMELQADGKIVVGCATQEDFAVLRFNNDGSLDTGFDGDGVVTTSFTADTDGATCIVVLPDGRIVAAGYAGDFDAKDFAVARYTASGALDNTFSSDGKLTTAVSLTGDDDQANAIAVRPDGSIVVAGSASNSPVNGVLSMAVVCYDEQGQLVGSFGSGGIRQFTFGGGSHTVALGIALQSDERIVLAGYASDGGGSAFGVARLTVDGNLDPSFFGGTRAVGVGSGQGHARGVVVQVDGKIVLAGLDGSLLALMRFNQDGSLDPTFGVAGIATVAANGDAKGVALQADNKILTVGRGTEVEFNGGILLARFLSGVTIGMDEGRAAVDAPMLYPNPATDQITLRFQLPSAGPYACSLWSLDGRIVTEVLINTLLQRGRQELTLSVAHLPAGPYLLRFRGDTDVFTVPFVKH